MTNKTLAQLYAEHSGKVSDKWLHYLTEYQRILNEYQNRPIHILEIGIQNGGSLEIWAKYFSHAQKVVGCDINPDCARLIYEDPRIAVVTGDANSDAVQQAILAYAPAFDVIIDDGSHRSSDIVKSFARYFPHLTDGGVYVLEDLHCSYWAEYEGGLLDPFSSITFFKLLVDIVNFEHWGLDCSPSILLAGFESQYGIHLDENLISHVHAVEFMNSLCLIRKDDPSQNKMSERVIGGFDEGIVAGYVSLAGSACPVSQEDQKRFEKHYDSFAVNREQNVNAIQILSLNQAVAKRDAQIGSLNQAVAERDVQIGSLNQAVADRDAQIGSLNQAVAERDVQIGSLNQAVADRDAQIGSFRVRELGRDYQIVSLNQSLAERVTQIGSLNEAVSERDSQISQLQEWLREDDAEFNNQILDRESQIEHFKARNEELEATVICLRNELLARESQLESVYRSISWRIASPVRFLGRTIRPRQ
ncbi:MAG: class I SAM-dependent methyltransferase [Desulfomonilaceae bacterium]